MSQSHNARHSVGKTKAPRETADVIVGLFWNAKAKAWDIRVEHVGGTVAIKRAESTAELDFAACWELADAIQAKLEAMLW